MRSNAPQSRWGSTNEFGSSLVYGHPQAPTGARLIAELVEALRRRGGGTGRFTGCAAGDTGGAVVLGVDVRPAAVKDANQPRRQRSTDASARCAHADAHELRANWPAAPAAAVTS
jgi:hypothetical protein